MTLPTAVRPAPRVPPSSRRVPLDRPLPRIAKLMTPGVQTIVLGTSLREALRLFQASGACELFVLGRDGRHVGRLSEHDLIRAGRPSGHVDEACRHDTPIDACVVFDALALRPDDDPRRAAALMFQRQVHRLPVVADGLVVGTIGRAALYRVMDGG